MMAVFWTLLVKVLPLYLTIGLGYISGKYLHVKKEMISPLLIYIIVPIIVFNGVATTPLTLQHISLPFVFFLLCCFICFFFLWLSSRIWQDATGIVNLARELKSFPEKNATGKEKAEEWRGRCEITPLLLLLLPDSIYEIAAA